MQKHTRVYFKAMGYDWCDTICCELCESKGTWTTAVDIAHIQPRGAGGRKGADTIDNLMALCRPCHHKTEGNKQDKDMLREVHKNKMKERCSTF